MSPRGRRNAFAVGADRDTCKGRSPLECLELLTVARIPQGRRILVRRRDQTRAIRTERHGPDLALEVLEGAQQFASGDMPQLDCLVRGSGDEKLAIGT